MSLLASMCINVYERESAEVIKVGPDQYSYFVQHKVLYISIAGTFNEVQHVMNALPFVYHAGQRTLTALGMETNNPTSTAAYAMGEQHGWIEPASNIFSSLRSRIDIETFQRVVICGHSRGGLLSYYLALHVHRVHPGIQVHVVGFGMPVPLSACQDSEREFIRDRVLCVKNINDPISNLICEQWEPRVIVVGEALSKREVAVAQPPSKPEPQASLWGFVSGLAEIAVNYAKDSLTELREKIENHHPITTYAKLITGTTPEFQLPETVRRCELDGSLFLVLEELSEK